MSDHSAQVHSWHASHKNVPPFQCPFLLNLRTSWTVTSLTKRISSAQQGTPSKQASVSMTYSKFAVHFRSRSLKIHVWRSQKHGRECCHFESGSPCLWRQEGDRHVWHKCPRRHQTTFVRSPLVKRVLYLNLWSVPCKRNLSTTLYYTN